MVINATAALACTGEWSAKVHTIRRHCPKCENAFNTRTRACAAFLVLPFGRGLHKSGGSFDTQREREGHTLCENYREALWEFKMPGNYNNASDKWGLRTEIEGQVFKRSRFNLNLGLSKLLRHHVRLKL